MESKVSVDPEAVKAQVARQYGWRQIDVPGKQFYAVDEQGQTLWLKSRTKDTNSPSWDWRNPDIEFDALVGILVSPQGGLLLIIQVPNATVQELKRDHGTRKDGQDDLRLRWNRDNACHRGVRILFDAGGYAYERQ